MSTSPAPQLARPRANMADALRNDPAPRPAMPLLFRRAAAAAVNAAADGFARGGALLPPAERIGTAALSAHYHAYAGKRPRAPGLVQAFMVDVRNVLTRRGVHVDPLVWLHQLTQLKAAEQVKVGERA